MQSKIILRDWQQRVISDLKRDTIDSSINILIAGEQSVGKTTLSRICLKKEIAISINIVDNYNEILESVYINPKLGGYLIDIPNFIKGENLEKILRAIDNVKLGSFTYKDSKVDFESPRIWIFMDSLPDMNIFCKLKYSIFEVDSNYNLIRKYKNFYKEIEHESNLSLEEWERTIVNDLTILGFNGITNIVISKDDIFDRFAFDDVRIYKINKSTVMRINIDKSHKEIYVMNAFRYNITGYLFNISISIPKEELRLIFRSLRKIKRGVIDDGNCMIKTCGPRIWIRMEKLPKIKALKRSCYASWEIVDNKLVPFK